MPQSSTHGRFVWQELLTDDTATAAGFYPKVVGWRATGSEREPGYTLFSGQTGTVSGMMRLPEDVRARGARPHWLPYIGAEDVDATVALAGKLGGGVLRPATSIAGVGRYAVLSDGQGATFAIFRPEEPSMSASAAAKPGEFSWHELATTDIEAAFEFYRELFGWQVIERMNMGPAGTYLIFGWEGGQRGGIYKLSEQSPVPYWLSYAAVPDADVAVQLALAAGGRVAVGPMDVPGGGRIAQLLDPSGVLFAVHAPLRPARPRAPARSARSRRSAALPVIGPTAKAGKKAAKKAAKKAKRIARRAAGKATAAAGKTARRRKVARKAATKGARRTAKKAAKKASRKAAGKATRRPARRARSAARRSSGTIGRTPARRVRSKSGGRRLAKRSPASGRRAGSRARPGRRVHSRRGARR